MLGSHRLDLISPASCDKAARSLCVHGALARSGWTFENEGGSPSLTIGMNG